MLFVCNPLFSWRNCGKSLNVRKASSVSICATERCVTAVDVGWSSAVCYRCAASGQCDDRRRPSDSGKLMCVPSYPVTQPTINCPPPPPAHYIILKLLRRGWPSSCLYGAVSELLESLGLAVVVYLSQDTSVICFFTDVHSNTHCWKD